MDNKLNEMSKEQLVDLIIELSERLQKIEKKKVQREDRINSQIEDYIMNN